MAEARSDAAGKLIWTREQIASLVASEPLLAPLAESYGAAAVWFGSLETNGFPPTWDPMPDSLLKLHQFLERMRTR